MNKLVKNIELDNLNSEFLTAVNGVLQLTNRELELMTEFIDMDVNYENIPNKNKNVANRFNRKKITQKLGITPDNLSRYIKGLKEKGILITGPAEDELRVRKTLIPEIIGDRVQLTIILKLKDGNKSSNA